MKEHIKDRVENKRFEKSNRLFLILLFLYSRYRFRKWGGQFIEWNDKGIIYKARETSPTEISYDSIQDIAIHLDTIVFSLADGGERTLLIEDYQEYEDRLRIKANFEKIRPEHEK